MKTSLRLSVPLLAALSVGCINGGQHLAGLYAFDYSVVTEEVPRTDAAHGPRAEFSTVCRPVLETTRKSSPVSDPAAMAADPFLSK